jgi:hypothetical protein
MAYTTSECIESLCFVVHIEMGSDIMEEKMNIDKCLLRNVLRAIVHLKRDALKHRTIEGSRVINENGIWLIEGACGTCLVHLSTETLNALTQLEFIKPTPKEGVYMVRRSIYTSLREHRDRRQSFPFAGVPRLLAA